MTDNQMLPLPQGPEYAPCGGCGHIEPEHREDAGACLLCRCRAYRPAAVSAVVAPPTDQAALRDRIAEALISWTYRGKEPDPNVGILETVRANAYSRADAVLAVLPPTDLADECPQCGTTGACNGGPCPLLHQADDEQPGARHVHITIHHPDPTTATTAAHAIADLIRGEYSDSLRLTITTDAPGTGAAPSRPADKTPGTTPQSAEDPARIDRLRPEFAEHASVEAIDAQLQRARRQMGLWEQRVRKLTGLRQKREGQPAAGARQDGGAW